MQWRICNIVKVNVGDREVVYDGYLEKNLALLKRMVTKKDFDGVIVVDGGEGFGKSVLAQQVAKYFDHDLSMDRIVFDAEEFVKAVQAAKPYQCIVFDEAYGGLAGRETMTKINRIIVKMLAEVRQKNLFLIFVCPSFFDLDRYVALWRSRCLLNVYLGKGLQRGFVSFYNVTKKKQLYLVGKKTYSYKLIKPNFRARFPKGYVVDEKEYRAKKLQALMSYGDDDMFKKNDTSVLAGACLSFMRHGLRMGWSEIIVGLKKFQSEPSQSMLVSRVKNHVNNIGYDGPRYRDKDRIDVPKK